MSSIALQQKLRELERKLKGLEDKVPNAIAVALRESMRVMVRHVQERKLSGQYLRVQTGTARRSFRQSVKFTRAVITGIIGSPFAYVRAHEEGFRGTVKVGAHTRRRRVHAIGKRGQKLKRSKWEDRGSIQVRGHTRRVNMRARRFLQDTMRENVGRTRLRVIRSLSMLAKMGRVPTAAEVRSGFKT